jgi:hypothetical protein
MVGVNGGRRNRSNSERPAGPGEFVHVSGDALDDCCHLHEVDGHDGPYLGRPCRLVPATV